MEVCDNDSVTAATFGSVDEVFEVVCTAAEVAVTARSCGGGYFAKKFSNREGSCAADMVAISLEAFILPDAAESDGIVREGDANMKVKTDHRELCVREHPLCACELVHEAPSRLRQLELP